MGANALDLPRGWPSIELRGYREHPAFATYSIFDYEQLPPIKRDLDDQLSWLLQEPSVEHSLAGGHVYEGDPVRPATGGELDALIEAMEMPIPSVFETFIRTPEPRSRVRSCVDEKGADAVVSTYVPYGFALDASEEPEWAPDFDPSAANEFMPGASASVVCADSFSEFLYRFWIENELWFAINDSHDELTREQREYVDHYLLDRS